MGRSAGKKKKQKNIAITILSLAAAGLFSIAALGQLLGWYDVFDREPRDPEKEIRGYIEEYMSGKEVVLKAGDVRYTLNAYAAGMEYDYDGLSGFLSGKGKSVSRYADFLDGGRKLQPEKKGPDEEYIRGAVAEFAQLLDKGWDHGYEKTAEGVKIIRGRPHTKIDGTQLATYAKMAFINGDYGEIEAKTWDIAPGDPDWDAILSKVCTPPVDAAYGVDENGLTKIISPAPGKMLDFDLMKKELAADAWPSKEYVLYDAAPAKALENLNDGLFGDLLASYSTKYRASEKDRTTNLELSAGAVNGYVVLPGEKFSFNGVVGERTAAKGYKSAPIIANSEYVPELGGGICQVTSTLYNAALLANMQQFSRYFHSLAVSYVPLGLDATVYWGSLDYAFINNTKNPIRLTVTMNNGTLKAEIHGTKDYKTLKVELRTEIVETTEPEEKVTIDETLPVGYREITKKGSQGFVVDTYKTVTVDGVAQKEVRVSRSKYRAVAVQILSGPVDTSVTTPAADGGSGAETQAP